MKNIKLNTDTDMPVIGLGTWRAAPGQVYSAVRCNQTRLSAYRLRFNLRQ